MGVSEAEGDTAMLVREPAVDGLFYRADKAGLIQEVESCFWGSGGPGSLPTFGESAERHIVALVSPHAGFQYSGSVAAWVYYRLAEDGIPDVAVIIGPNHNSWSPAVALTDETAWMTPLGKVEIEKEVTHLIAGAYPGAVTDVFAHRPEHSIEVQLPFLQYIAQLAGVQVCIVPILIGSIAYEGPGGGVEAARRVGTAIAEALMDRNSIIIASTDFTHRESAESAWLKDSKALDAILAMDEQKLLNTVREFRISMCGALPTAIAIAAAKELGAISTRQLAYRTSGDVTGDYSDVVGYGALEMDKVNS